MKSHFKPFHARDFFDTTWKHQKIRSFLMFSGVSKEISGMKWVKQFIKKKGFFWVTASYEQLSTFTTLNYELGKHHQQSIKYV